MAVLKKSQHEQFAQLVATGIQPRQAYATAYGSAKGADQSASRLLKNAQVSSRIGELRLVVAEKSLKVALQNRDYRLEQLQKRSDLLNRVITERGDALGKLSIHGYPMDKLAGKVADRAKDKPGDTAAAAEVPDVTPAPGAGTGLVCLDWRGKDAIQAVWKVDTGFSPSSALSKSRRRRNAASGSISPSSPSKTAIWRRAWRPAGSGWRRHVDEATVAGSMVALAGRSGRGSFDCE